MYACKALCCHICPTEFSLLGWVGLGTVSIEIGSTEVANRRKRSRNDAARSKGPTEEKADRSKEKAAGSKGPTKKKADGSKKKADRSKGPTNIMRDAFADVVFYLDRCTY